VAGKQPRYHRDMMERVKIPEKVTSNQNSALNNIRVSKQKLKRAKCIENCQNSQIFVCGGLEIFPRNLRTEKIPRKIIFISIKAFKRYVARFSKRLSQ